MNLRILLHTLPLFLTLLPVAAAERPQPWADFVEADFPFFSSVVDGRGFGRDWPSNNITPRGLVLNLGHECWAAFDTDLLRVSALWHGGPLSAVSMSQVSYQTVGDKTPEGQDKLPRPEGTPWLATGIYPGWQTGEAVSLTDPRKPGPDPEEVGRGPLADAQFESVQVWNEGAFLAYTVQGAPIKERMEARLLSGQPVIQRSFRLQLVKEPLWLVVGQRPQSAKGKLSFALTTGKPGAAVLLEPIPGMHVLQIKPSADPIEVQLAVGLDAPENTVQTWSTPRAPAASLRWPRVLITAGTNSSNKGAYVVDNIALPIPNPWQRNVRLADLGFFKDGRAAAVTFDGDVWIISGLHGDLVGVSWKRFASGLQEPLGLCLRDEEIFLNDRNGIWKLVDSDHNGEADRHELFSNAFRQTAETREYATGLRVLPDGSFVIAKGGITGSTVGGDNGSVLRISADGLTSTAIGWGLREPFIGVNRKTGLITASDQQGNYVPATPIHIVRDHRYYGYIPLILPKEKYPAPIADPLLWIPHPVNASAVGQVWLNDAQMGPLNEQLVHIGYYRPELFVVLQNNRAAKPQAAIVSLTQDLTFAPLNGCVNPIDGQLYVAGFKIWGTTAEAVSGLARLRYTGAPSTLPTEVAALDKGILLRFDTALDEKKALTLGNYAVERWNYKRTAAYGSPHYKLDGSKGQETMTPSSVYLSEDHKSVFLGLPDLKPVMQMRVGFALATAKGEGFERSAYLTPYEFAPFKPAAEGFGDVTVDLTPRETIAAVDTTPVTAEEGQRLYGLMGCVACHSTDGTVLGKIGPSWKGLFGSERPLSTGKKVVADEAYLLESIKDPPAKFVKGFDKTDNAMPSYDGIMTEKQMRAVVEYIKALK